MCCPPLPTPPSSREQFMTSLRYLLITACALIFSPIPGGADDPRQPAKGRSVADTAEPAQQPFAVIRFQWRNGQDQGPGSRFVLDAGGLLATNLQVIGDARPVS